jgi:hypothetical protein
MLSMPSFSSHAMGVTRHSRESSALARLGQQHCSARARGASAGHQAELAWTRAKVNVYRSKGVGKAHTRHTAATDCRSIALYLLNSIRLAQKMLLQHIRTSARERSSPSSGRIRR